MINLDTRLINELDGNELAVFCHIIKRINRNNECFPSRETLMTETGFGRDKIASALQSLAQKNILAYYQKNKGGKFTKTHYKIKTKLASVFINVGGEELIVDYRDTDFRTTENPLTGKSHLSINQALSINQKKKDTVKIDFDELLKFYNNLFNRSSRVVNSKNKKAYNLLLKDYKKKDIINAMKNAKIDSFHLENGLKYLTIEYFSRSKTIDRYAFLSSNVPSNDVVVKKMDDGEFVNF